MSLVEDKKKRILEFIKEEEKKGSGVPPSKITNRLGIPYYSLDPILEEMEKDKILVKTVKGKFRYYNTKKEKGEKN